MLSVLLLTVGGATKAWFTSTVTAEDNEIQVGTLLLAVDSTQNHGAYLGTGYLEDPTIPANRDGYNVVRELADGSILNNNTFEAWENAAPGDTFSVFAAVRNNGTLPLNARAMATGEWTAGPRFGTGTCPSTPGDADPSLVSVSNVHLYRATAAGGCEGVDECRNLRDALIGAGYTPHFAGVTAGDSGGVSGYYYVTEDGTDGSSTGSQVLLDEDEFVIYEVELTLSNTTDNCYQGATYLYDLTAEGKQEADPAW